MHYLTPMTMNRATKIYAFLTVGLTTVLLFAAYAFQDEDPTGRPAPRTAAAPTAGLSQRVESIPLRDAYDFAGEALPIDNFDVAERLDRELMTNSYWHSSTLQLIKLAHRYFPVIEPILAKNGVPDDFKYLAVAESGLRNVTSPAGAKGFWQFMPATGREYDLEINREVDERYHLEKATQAACEYLLDKYRRTNSWITTAAMYNAGEARINGYLNEMRADHYFDLNLGEETARYVFRLVAMKEILRDPEHFGFYVPEADRYAPLTDFSTVTVTESIDNLGDFAKQYGTSYRMLKVYNPWLVESSLPISSGNSYEIRVPKD